MTDIELVELRNLEMRIKNLEDKVFNEWWLPAYPNVTVDFEHNYNIQPLHGCSEDDLMK